MTKAERLSAKERVALENASGPHGRVVEPHRRSNFDKVVAVEALEAKGLVEFRRFCDPPDSWNVVEGYFLTEAGWTASGRVRP